MSARVRTSLAINAALAAVAFSATVAERTAAAACSCPKITRDKIIEIAKTGVGSRYIWGGTCWDPANRKSSKGADCSGYVTKTWQVPKASAVTSCVPHYYTTATFQNSSTHWTSISRSNLTKGDALVYNSSGAGHIVLYEKNASSGCYVVYEARGSAYGIIHRTKCCESKYKARRRHNIVAPAPPAPPPPPPEPKNTPPGGVLEGANCEAIVGWAQDLDAKTTAIKVKLYFDSKPGDGQRLNKTITAGIDRSDLCDKLGSCKHGFKLATPLLFKDGKTHLVRAFAVDSAGGESPELAHSPLRFACANGSSAPIDTTDAGVGEENWDRQYADDGGLFGVDQAFEVINEAAGEDTIYGGCATTPRGARGSLASLLLAVAALLLVRRRASCRSSRRTPAARRGPGRPASAR